MKRTKRRLLVWSAVLLATLFAGFLASGVALAQSTQEFDLGCRAELTAGGSWTQYPTVGVALHSSVGQWNAGRTRVQGSGIVDPERLHAGRRGSRPMSRPRTLRRPPRKATATLEESAVVLDGVYLPAIYAVNFIRFVRPCNWTWASAVPSVD